MAQRLTNTDKAALKKLYTDRFTQVGRGAKAVGWRDHSDQSLRFEVLSRGFELKGASVLDFGCGLGDYLNFMTEQTGGDHRYVGVDLVEVFIDDAKARFGNAGTFVCGGIDEALALGSFDYVVSSGVFTFKTSDNLTTTQSALNRLFKKCRRGLASNFMSSYVDHQLEKNSHYQPEEMFSFAKKLSRRVALYHDYPLWEFTIQILKETSDV